MSDLVRRNNLRDLTPARVSLGRAGSSLDTTAVLDFALAHAMARDAVHAALSLPTLLEGLQARRLEAIAVKSAAPDRIIYLRRPDLGRKLSETSQTRLTTKGIAPGAGARRLASETWISPGPTDLPRLTIILGDGLSALATDRNALPLLDALLPALRTHFTLTPTVVAEQCRVALGDEVGELLQSDLTLMLLGERPGLSSPDSLGAYLTLAPRIGKTDAERNCVSNIRPEGLDYATAAIRITYLCIEAHRLGQTGTALKEAQKLSLPSEKQSLPLGGSAGL